ncbi:MAG: hypothetical protein ACHQZR_02920 [Candidatus Limnocylindrales bacterium]
MSRITVGLSLLLTVVWLVVVALCLSAGLTLIGLIILVGPGVLWLVGLVALRMYWHRHPEHRQIGDWFTEEHHIGHW